MNKAKLLLATLCCSALVLSGCSVDVNRIIGNVSEESMKTDSALYYKGKALSKDEAKIYLTVAQLQYEDRAAKQGQLKDDFWETKPQPASKETQADILKKNVIDNMKTTLALMAHADEYKVTLAKADEDNILDSTKKLLGQTYKNMFVEYFKSKNLPVTEDEIVNFTKNQQLAQNVRKVAVETEKFDNKVNRAIKYNQIIVQAGQNVKPEEAKATAEKVKEKISKGGAADAVAKEHSLQATVEYLEEGGISPFDPAQTKAILAVKKGGVGVVEIKTNNTVVGYVVANVVDQDTDEIKNNVLQKKSQTAKEAAFNAKLEGWKKEVKVNQEFFDKAVLKADKKFWDEYVKPSTLEAKPQQ